jgi:hypothetical protein
MIRKWYAVKQKMTVVNEPHVMPITLKTQGKLANTAVTIT